MTKVKICGITNYDDALVAVEAGADALGFVFYTKSPRAISPERALRIIEQLPPLVQVVGLFVDESLATVNRIADLCGLDIVQLHGNESPEFCAGVKRRVLKALRVKDAYSLTGMPSYHVAGFLLDTWSPGQPGGTGKSFNWNIVKHACEQHRIVLAGGLTLENIQDAIRQVHPYGVDISSGVERAPGLKDPEKVRSFIKKAKEHAPSAE